MSPWEVGDIGVCIEDPFESNLARMMYGPHPIVGKLYRVVQVEPCGHCGTIGLRIDPGLKDIVFHAGNFRKVQKADDEFTEQMRKLRPTEKVRDKELEDA